MGKTIIEQYNNDSARIARYQQLISDFTNAYSAVNQGKALPQYIQKIIPQMSYTVETYEHNYGVRFESFSYQEYAAFYEKAIIGSSSSVVINRNKLTLLSCYLDYLVLQNILTTAQVTNHPFHQLFKDSPSDSRNGSQKPSMTTVANPGKPTLQQSLDVYSQQMLFSEEEFESLMDAIFHNRDQDFMPRAVYTLAWCGVKVKDIALIKKADVDLTRRVIYATEQNHLTRNIVIPSSFCLINLENAMTATSILVSYRDGIREAPFFGRDGYVIRGLKGANKAEKPDPDANGYYIVNNINRIYSLRREKLPENNPFKNKKVLVSSCYKSGQFLRLFKTEQPIEKLWGVYSNDFVYSYRKWLSYKQLNLK